MRTITITSPTDRNITIHLGEDAVQLATRGADKTIPADSLEWSETLLDGEAVPLEEAEKAAAKLGDGWRLPTRRELESLIDLTRHDPAIDTDRFPDTRSNWYWTSTPCAWNEAACWVVYFSLGLVNYNHRDDSACVRAVRAGQ